MSAGAPLEDRFVGLPHGPRICYRTHGDDGAPTMLLVAGLNQQLHAWTASFVDRLVARGLRVVTFDNRDTGRSSASDRPAPSRLQLLAGRARPDAYTLADLAEDAWELLDALRVDRAHLVGHSMGGMIAQAMAATVPDRTLSLASISSTTGAPRVGQAAWSTKLRLAAPPPRSAREAADAHVAMMRHLDGRLHPTHEPAERRYARVAWWRGGGPNPGGIARHVQAITASGDRTSQLAAVTAPTLVVHGDRDLIVDPSGGAATAAAIPRAAHLVIPGMGHPLAPTLESRIADAVCDNALHRHLSPLGAP